MIDLVDHLANEVVQSLVSSAFSLEIMKKETPKKVWGFKAKNPRSNWSYSTLSTSHGIAWRKQHIVVLYLFY